MPNQFSAEYAKEDEFWDIWEKAWNTNTERRKRVKVGEKY